MRDGIVRAMIGAASAALLSCGGSDDEAQLIVMLQTRQILASGFVPRESDCMSLSLGNSDSEPSLVGSGSVGVPRVVPADGDGAPISDGFGVTRSEVPEGLRVFAFAGPQALAIKIYTKAFFETGKTDRFEVTTPVGTRYELAHRGARLCEGDVDLFAE
jgi:hypothetical protein